MSDLIDVQVEMYPTLLRRMAAGEHLASQQDDTEKLAATLLAAEAIEAEKAAQAPVEKQAIDIGIGTLALGALAAPKIKELLNKLRGVPLVPEESSELIKSFRKIMEAQAETRAARGKMLAIGLGAAGAGALAIKALEGKKQDKVAAHEESEKDEEKDEKGEEKKNLPPWLKGKSDKDEKSEKKEEPKSDKSDDKKSEKKDDKKSDEKKDEKGEKDEDEKDSADVAVSNNPAGKVAVKTGSPSAHAVLARLMKSFA